MREKDTYKEIRTFRDSKAIIKVYSPILTDEEREMRMKELYKAAENILRKD